MVAKACVVIRIPIRNEQITIPCHRHADAYEILNALHFRDGKEYYVVAEGFLDENDNFLTRLEAWHEAFRCNQFPEKVMEECYLSIKTPTALYSEDLW